MVNELLIPKMDRYSINVVLNTFKLTIDLTTLAEDYKGDIRIVKECVDSPEGERVWVGRVYKKYQSAHGHIDQSDIDQLFNPPWEQIGVDVIMSDTAGANLLDKRFKAFASVYHAMRGKNKPSCTYLMANRVAQYIYEHPEVELVDFIDNDMFMDAEAAQVEVISTLEVLGAKYKDLRRIDTLVVSRRLDIGVSGDLEILCNWPVVICGRFMAFNQFIPGPVLSLGNLVRQYDVMDINTKDLQYVAATPVRILEQDDSIGTVKLEKYDPASDSYIRFTGTAMGIFPASPEQSPVLQ